MTQTFTQLGRQRELKRLLDEKKHVQARLQQAARKLDRLDQRIIQLNKTGGSARRLLKAAADGSVSQIKHLISAGAPLDAKNASRETALHLASYREKNDAVIRALLTAGADPNARDKEGNAPLITCVRDRNIEAVKELIKHGADVNAGNNEGDTPLTNAAAWGSIKVAAYLLKHGADANLRDGAGISPADLARQQNHLELAKLLEDKAR